MKLHRFIVAFALLVMGTALTAGSAFGFSAADAGSIHVCVDWIDGFTGHLDGIGTGISMATAGAPAVPGSVKELTEAIHREWNEIKEKAETKLETLPDAEELGEYKELFEKFDERFNKLEAAAKRLKQTPAQVNSGELPPEAKAQADDFEQFLKVKSSERKEYAPGEDVEYLIEVVPRYKMSRDGLNVLTFDYNVVEAKALSVDSDPAGGFLVSPTMAQTTVQRIFDTSPIRQYAGIETISGDAYEEVVDDDEVSVGWVGETQARSETDTADLDKLRIPMQELYANPRSTQKMLDMRASVEDWLTGKVSDKMTREEATQFVTGDGVNKPKGVLEYVNDSSSSWNAVKSVASGDADQVTPEGLISVKADLQTFYLNGAVWFFNRTTRSSIRKFRHDAVTADDGQGGFMWEPGLRAGDPDMLLGYPITIFEDMPDEVADAYPVGFGNLREGYLIIDHTSGINVLRDPYSAKPYVEFYTTKRVGGGVRQGRALRLMKCST